MNNCMECEESNVLVFEDPRVPPLGFDLCLCRECGLSAHDERIEELQEEIRTLKQNKKAPRSKGGTTEGLGDSRLPGKK